jgi:hypothetical protein
MKTNTLTIIIMILLLAACSSSSPSYNLIHEESVDELQFKIDFDIGNTVHVDAVVYNKGEKEIPYLSGGKDCLAPVIVTITSETGEELLYEESTKNCRESLIVNNLRKVQVVVENSYESINDHVGFYGTFQSPNNTRIEEGEYTVAVTLRQLDSEGISIEFPINIKDKKQESN